MTALASSYTTSSLERASEDLRFLVIEDDPDIAALMSLHLQDMGAQVDVVANGKDGLHTALNGHWHTIVLDLQLPEMDGLDICRTLRMEKSNVPLMMVTSRASELDRVLGLELGADDYLVKPFSVAELKARVKALLRRSSMSTSVSTVSRIECGGLSLDEHARTAFLDGQALDLTAKEFDLLWFFASQPSRVFKRGELLDKVWGYGHEGYEHTVNSHINRLRSKIEADPAHPQTIQTVWGVGYRFGGECH